MPIKKIRNKTHVGILKPGVDVAAGTENARYKSVTHIEGVTVSQTH